MMLQSSKTSTASKTNQLKRDAKLIQEMEQETTKILSPLFNDMVWLNRAYLILKGQGLQESEGRFKTLVLILNGRIKHSLKLSFDAGILRTTKIFSYILELDALIREVMELPRTPSLDHFQSFAKGILFRNIGDTFLLLHHIEKGNRMYEELAFVSYSIAYDIFYKASPVSSLLAAIFVLETFVLRTLLQHFNRVKLSSSTTQLVGERLYAACSGVTTSRSKSFMISINSVPSTHETHHMEQNKISRLINLADKNDFLINLLWLLAHNGDMRDNASFLDLFLKNIPAETSGDDLQSFTLSSFCKIDAKVLLLGAAKWSELCTSHVQKYGISSLSILPPLAFAQPNFIVLNFWKLLLSFNKESRINHSSQLCSENRIIIAALEASRLRGEIPDVRIVDYVRKWLVANGNALGDTKGNWAKLYSRVFMDLINGAHYANQGVSTEDSFFPPLNDSDYDMLDDAEKWFSLQDSSVSHNADLVLDESAESKLGTLPISQTESIEDAPIKPKSLLQRICTSAKAMLPSDYNNSVISSSCAPKNDSIKALELLTKDYKTKCKNEASTSFELNDLSSIIKKNKVEENLYAEIIKMQNEHAWDVCKLVQTINSLEETVKQYSRQYANDLAIYTSKAYKQGYNDGYCSALQTNSNVANLMESTDQHAISSITQKKGFLEDQDQKASDVEYSHNPDGCVGCASEEEQDRFLRILDKLADSGVV
ncbi:Uncharacterized protein BM_BM9215 [Brugia malayi]|uniref:Bm9215 n=1 Tax=Brugia malayi TaxID=6279 RepID=A0A0J9XPU8_BRUMA|nr:Uncharacterized protein BM_BM9215 [Brugia malayi]CDP93217.1 Bm9215 [Brugia malayi]VIO91953.1 Uncharacterized protein BM_BM9215 [Brugia malayi]